MHNRVRMIVASFFAKDLLVHWRRGEEWFWDTLVDADEANNANGWQWTAGTGADAAPYFRVFNPVLQGEKFDPEWRLCAPVGSRAWRNCPPKWIQKPVGGAGQSVLTDAGVSRSATAIPKPDHRS